MTDPIAHLNAALTGRYRIERRLGEGGMATVYLARDVKHDRRVALKVLKPELAAVVGAERFLAEIKTTANLQHPHILPLFDSGEADGFLFYVMPFVEGETLRERIARDRQLPVAEAVNIATAVATALHAAHGQGVVHRDIKPGNILLSRGQPLIADFGIALAVNAGGGERFTETGLSLGTPHYMSPEQATGDQAVGPAADQYALGAVLYEMLVGEPPHTGATAQAILGKIIQGSLTAPRDSRPTIPGHVDAAVRRALEPLPADRFPDLAAFERALGNPGFTWGAPGGRAGTAVLSRTALVMGALAIAAVAFGAGVLLPGGDEDAPSRPPIHLTVPLVTGTAGVDETVVRIPTAASQAVDISPDGRWIVYRAGDTLRTRLFLRDLHDRVETVELVGIYPAFSPDGSALAYVTEDQVRRRRVQGGDEEVVVQSFPEELDPHRSPFPSVRWTDDDELLFLFGGQGFWSVPAAGGELRQVTDFDAYDDGPPWDGGPWTYDDLPGQDRVLIGWRPGDDPASARIGMLDRRTGALKPLIENGSDPRWHRDGYLLFLRDANLMAVRYDPRTDSVAGDPRVLLTDVWQRYTSGSADSQSGVGHFALADDGTLLVARGDGGPEVSTRPFRVSLDGDTTFLDLEARYWRNVQESRDGSRLLLTDRAGRRGRFVIYDLERDSRRTIDDDLWTPQPGYWSGDETEIVYGTAGGVTAFPVSGDGDPRFLGEGGWLTDVSASGIAMSSGRPGIWTLAPGDSVRSWFVRAGPSEEYARATLSPDERWMLYDRLDRNSGNREVYLRPYPGPGEPVQVSVRGGLGPSWAPDMRRIFYVRSGGEGTLVYVDVTLADGAWSFGPEVEVVDGWRVCWPDACYDVSRRGDIIGLGPTFTVAGAGWLSRLDVILNFDEVIRERLGG